MLEQGHFGCWISELGALTAQVSYNGWTSEFCSRISRRINNEYVSSKPIPRILSITKVIACIVANRVICYHLVQVDVCPIRYIQDREQGKRLACKRQFFGS